MLEILGKDDLNVSHRFFGGGGRRGERFLPAFGAKPEEFVGVDDLIFRNDEINSAKVTR